MRRQFHRCSGGLFDSVWPPSPLGGLTAPRLAGSAVERLLTFFIVCLVRSERRLAVAGYKSEDAMSLDGDTLETKAD